MNSHKKTIFCEQFANWLLGSEWHFTTLLTTTIESVRHLPDDADKLINKLLLAFPAKPSSKELLKFLDDSAQIDSWFRIHSTRPEIKSYNLDLIKLSNTIRPHLPKLESTIDLVGWLNITLGELEWLADLWRPDLKWASKLKHYHYSLLEKRRGGVRLIESPKSLLKEIQRKINSDILLKVPVHNAAHAFCVSRSPITHAQNHVNKKTLLLFDISNCFHSIQWISVYRTFSRLGYSKEVTKYLTGLCTHQLNKKDVVFRELDSQQRNLIQQRHLPQGAPTSPALSNIIMNQLDKRLTGLSDKLNLNYSRYADDLAFSSNKNRNWKFLEPLIGSICLDEGFELNYHKSRIIKRHQRQKLTGIVINQSINIDRRYYDQLKATLTNCVRFGLESQNRNNHKHFYAHLVGAVNHVYALNENRGTKLRKILAQIVVV